MARNTTKQLTCGLLEKVDRFGHVTFLPQGKGANTAPAIIYEYYEEEIVKDPCTGTVNSKLTRMYECEPAPGSLEPRIFIADKYDHVFVPAHNKKLMTGKLKGSNGNYTTRH